MATTQTVLSRPQIRPQIRPPSVLMMSDRLISLAQDADRGGYSATASQLVLLAHAVFDENRA